MANQFIYNLTDSWADAGTLFTAIKMNVTDTASDASSLLMDLQVGGTSVFNFGKTGWIGVPVNRGIFQIGNSGFNINLNQDGTIRLNDAGGGIRTATGLLFLGGSDLILRRAAAASLQLGNFDAASPIAQTLQVQSVSAGTTNTAGANFTINGSAGTGTGAGGSIIFQVAPAGSSGSSQNPYSTALTIASDKTATFASGATFNSSTVTYGTSSIVYVGNGGVAQGGFRTYGNDATGIYWPVSGRMILYNNVYGGEGNITLSPSYTGYGHDEAGNILSARYSSTLNSIVLGPTTSLSWAGSGNSRTGTPDVLLIRDAANTLALRNGANAQTLRIYSTYTDASNYQYASIWATTNAVYIGATGAGTSSPTIDFNIGHDGTAANANRKINFGTRTITFPGGGPVSLTGGSGNFVIASGAGGDIGMLQFGNNTSAFPALKRSGTLLQVRLADDSGDAPFSSGYHIITGGTITSNASPTVDISQTWNSSGNNFTAIKTNVTDTASASGSSLMDLQVGGTSKFRVDKTGATTLNGNITVGGSWNDFTINVPSGGGSRAFSIVEGGTSMLSASIYGVSIRSVLAFGASAVVSDVFLNRDAANTLALRNSTSAQTFNIYNTYTDGSNYERGFLKWNSNVLQIGTEKAGTGSTRNLELIAGGNTAVTIAPDRTSTFSGIILGYGGAGNAGELNFAGSISNNSNRFQIRLQTDWFLKTVDSEALVLGTSNVERMRIASGGNVSIGAVTSPANKLDVRGTLGVGQSSNSAFNVLTISTTNTGSDNHIETFAGPPHGTNDDIIFDLSRGGGAYGGFEVKFVGTSRFLVPGGALKGDGYINLPTNSNFVFKNNNTEGMRFDANGRVGIGTSSPQAQLEIYNLNRYVLRLTGPVSNGPIIDLYRQNTRTAFIETDSSNNFLLAVVQQGPSLSLRTNGGAGPVDRLVIDTNGNMRVGTNKLATNATDGFLYIPSCDGTPTGTPTTHANTVPIVVDTTNNKLYFYSGGAWRDAGP